MGLDRYTRPGGSGHDRTYSAAQRRGLAWCEREGIYDAGMIEGLGATRDFVRALSVASEGEELRVFRALQGGFPMPHERWEEEAARA